jgi:hypothetical protein
MDPATKFAAEQRAFAGTFSIPAYPGNFTVLVRECGTPTRSNVSTVSLASDASVNLTLGTRGADASEADLNLTTWKTARRTVQTELFDRAAQDRFLADQFGNRDGVADAAELHVIRAMESGYFAQPFRLSDLLVDGRPTPYRSILSFEVGGAGPIVSTADVTETLVADSWLLMDPIGTRHNVTLWFPYDSPFGTSRFTIHLPPEVTGNATSPGNVTIVRIGPGAWSVDPGTSPAAGSNPAHYGPDQSYVTIDAIAPESAPAAVTSIPLEWVLGPSVGIGVVAILGTVWWLRRRGRKPPDVEPKLDGA